MLGDTDGYADVVVLYREILRELLLLVACSSEQVGGVMRRLASNEEETGSPRLRIRTWEAMPPPDGGWAGLFADLSPWP